MEKKHEIRLPLGWKTRGQATLEPGPENEGDPSYGVILAKAGISLSDDYDTIQDQSEYICNLFFQRTPEDRITSKSLTGIRDMIDYDADLVEKELDKQLNMGFVWKRRPYAIGTSPE